MSGVGLQSKNKGTFQLSLLQTIRVAGPVRPPLLLPSELERRKHQRRSR